MNSTFDYCILGAGLAGLSLANELLKEGVTVCIIDPKGVAGGASGAPIGLVNPATGRYASLSWKSKECYTAILSNLEKIQKETPSPFFKKTGVLRPSSESKIARRMKENFESMAWPVNWIEWLDELEIKEINKELACIDGGVWLPIGLTVNIPTYLNTFLTKLKKDKLCTYFNKEFTYKRKRENWEIGLLDNESLKVKNLVFASGAAVRHESIWNFLPVIPVKGQVAVLENREPITFDYAISSLGYIASMDQKEIVLGSTYEHRFEHSNPDEKGLEYLLRRLDKVLPTLITSSKVIARWAGVRASTPNRMPILGAHPTLKNCFVFTGLGSKGLLYSSYLAQQLSRYLLAENELPEEVNIERFGFSK